MGGGARSGEVGGERSGRAAAGRGPAGAVGHRAGRERAGLGVSHPQATSREGMWSPFSKGEPEGTKKSNIDEANRHIEALDAKACSLSAKLNALQVRMELMEREAADLRAERDSLRDILHTATAAFTRLRESGRGEEAPEALAGDEGGGVAPP